MALVTLNRLSLTKKLLHCVHGRSSKGRAERLIGMDGRELDCKLHPGSMCILTISLFSLCLSLSFFIFIFLSVITVAKLSPYDSPS